MDKKIELSPEQNRASNPEINVWVQANAGTGKTFVLVQRLLRILFRAKSLNDCGILCLTYTKAAAGEMRTRILKRLSEWATAPDDVLREMLENVVRELPVRDADIMHARNVFFTYIDNPELLKIKTIHSFCEEILRRFPLEAGISPSWTLMSDETQGELLQNAFAKLVNSPADAKTYNAFEHIVGRISEGKLDKLLAILQNKHTDFFYITSNVKYREYFIDTIKNFLELNTPIQTEISASELKKIAHAAQEYQKSKKSSATYLKDIINYATQYIDTPMDFEKWRGLFLTTTFTKMAKVSKTGVPELLAEQDRLYKLTQHELNQDLFDDTMALYDILSAFAGVYNNMKQARKLLDYDDLILRTHQLFSDSQTMGWVLSQLNVKLGHILVDEAQDNSPEQWDIMRLIVDDFFAEGDTAQDPHSWFVVGDTKQSIYGFQGADPRAFESSRADISRAIQQNNREFADVPLSQSFRSMPLILKTVDRFFNDDFIKNDIGFVNNTHRSFLEDQDAMVEIHNLHITDNQAGNTRLKYIQSIANNIETLLADGKYQPHDIMVLVQRREPYTSLLIKELKRRNIDVAGNDRIKLPSFPAIRDMLHLVRFCLDTGNDYSLCCVLKSPIFRLKEHDIFEICKIRNDDNLRKSRESKTYNPTTVFAVLQDTFPDVYARLEQILEWSKTLSPYSFFTNVLNTNNTRESIVSALGDQVVDPLEEFLTICLSYERTQTGTLYHFLKWFITGNSEIKRDMDTASGVRIMSVHGAKGLEAKIVFLIDTTRMPKPDSLFQITPAEIPAEFRNFPTPWIWTSVSKTSDGCEKRAIAEAQHDREKIAEYYRLLYVAMTRAISRLYIYGTVSNATHAPDKSWFTQLWRVLSSVPTATHSDDYIRIEQYDE